MLLVKLLLMLAENGWSKRYLEKVLLVPEIKANLFSTTAALDKGFTMISTNDECKFVRNDTTQALGVREESLLKI